MKCPICGNEMEKGKVEASDSRSITNLFTTLIWYSEEQVKKFIRKGTNLKLNGEGYYCDECKKVVGIFDKK